MNGVQRAAKCPVQFALRGIEIQRQPSWIRLNCRLRCLRPSACRNHNKKRKNPRGPNETDGTPSSLHLIPIKLRGQKSPPEYGSGCGKLQWTCLSHLVGKYPFKELRCGFERTHGTSPKSSLAAQQEQ